MQSFKRLAAALLAALLAYPPALHAEQGASWLRTAVSNALNPKISVIGDFVAQAGPGEANDLSMREIEVAVQSEVDPNTRADFFFGLHDGESFELEEGFITLLSLPLGLQARGGKFYANFGRLNMVHDHELPQVDRPQALVDLLGDHGINSTGLEVSRVFTPFGLYTELTYAFVEALGEAHDEHGDPETTTITDDNGDPQIIAIHEEEAEDPNRTLRDFANVARLRLFRDVTDAANIDIGFSGAHYEPEGLESKTLGSVDLTFRWKPIQEGMYRSIIWRTEALYSRIKHPAELDNLGNVVEEEEEFERAGGYSYLEIQPSRRWRVGVRGDYVENPEGSSLEVTKGFSPYIALHANEFNRYRVQYRYRDLPMGERDHTGFFQWTVVLGPHSAHTF